MTIVAQRAAIAAAVEAGVTAFESVATFGGEFSVADILRYAVKSPAARVGCVGFSDGVYEAGTKAIIIQWIIVIVTRDGTVKRDAQALTLTEAVTGLVLGNNWGLQTGRPTDVRGRNLYSGEIDKKGLAIWAVTWVQRLEVDEYDETALDDFETMYTEWDLAPADGVVDMDGRLVLQGAFMSAYGQLTISSAIATSISVAGTYQKAAGTTVLGNANECDMPVTGRLRHTGTVAKPFYVTGAVSVTVSGDAKVTLALAKGGVVDTTTAIEQELTAAGGAEAFSLSDIVSLDENEYVEVWCTADDTINVTLTKMSLTAAAA